MRRRPARRARRAAAPAAEGRAGPVVQGAAWQGHAAMLAFAMAISVSFSLGDRAAEAIAPEALNAVRFALATLVLTAAAALGPGLRAAHYRAPWRFGGIGALLAVYFITMFAALRITDPVSTGAVFTLTPVMAAVAGWVLLRQRTPPRVALALTVGAAGALCVIFRADLSAFLAFDVGRGEAIFFFGCAAHGIYPAVTRRLTRGEPTLAMSLGTTAGAFAVICAAALWTGALHEMDWAALPPVVWIAVAYLAVMATALTVILVQFAALRLPAAKVMAYGYLVPSFVVVWEGVFGAGWPSPDVLAGIGVTAVAMVMLLLDDSDGAARPRRFSGGRRAARPGRG
ncbi:MAG: DMT family transporter [Pseudomonadota bacterium]